MTPQFNNNLQILRDLNKAASENKRQQDPFRDVVTLNATERSECVEMLDSMGIKIAPMANLRKTMTEIL